MDHDLFRARIVRIVAVLALTSAGFVAVGATPALAHPELCAEDGHDHEHDEICLSDEEIAAMDDSGADLGVDEIAATLQLTVPAVKSLLHRGRAALRGSPALQSYAEREQSAP